MECECLKLGELLAMDAQPSRRNNCDLSLVRAKLFPPEDLPCPSDILLKVSLRYVFDVSEVCKNSQEAGYPMGCTQIFVFSSPSLNQVLKAVLASHGFHH